MKMSVHAKVWQRLAALLLTVAKGDKVIDLYCEVCEKKMVFGKGLNPTLDIHHIKGGGRAHRKKYPNKWQYYRALVNTFCLDLALETDISFMEYQLLCRECHKNLHENLKT